MQYNGGKQLCAKRIAAIIGMFNPKVYWEPFVGCASVIEQVVASTRIGSDRDIHILSYLSLISQGWIPPDLKIDKLTYLTWKNYQPRTTEEFAIKAMIGYGCSFAGKFFDGWANNKRGDNFWAIAKRKSLSRQLNGIDFRIHCYLEANINADVIYCDPPYSSTTRVGSLSKFDSQTFWLWARLKASQGSTVLVSEFTAPSFAVQIWETNKNKGLTRSNGSQTMTERLFMVMP